MLKENKIKFNSKILFSIIFLLLFFIAKNTHAASINFTPSTNTSNVGDTIRINVLVSSNTPINGVSGKISFSNDILSVLSLSKDGSVISLWSPGEPSFSNSMGSVSFEGVSLTPLVGNNLNVITLILKAKTEGNANLVFNNISILANDGKGTNVFSGNLAPATILIKEAIIIEKPIEKTIDKVVPVFNKPVIENKIIPITEEKNKIDDIPKEEVNNNFKEAVNQVETENDIPKNLLLYSIIIFLIIIINFLIIIIFYIFFKKNRDEIEKLSKAEAVVVKSLNNLMKFSDTIFANTKVKSVKNYNNDIINNIKNSEQEIIAEIEKLK